MTTFYLIRHASNAYLDEKKIAGRLPGVHLNAEGRKQAQQLAERLAREPIRAIYTSPLERAYETAEPVAAKLGLSLQISEGLGEIRFGDWTDQPIAKLDTIPQWQRWNSFRSGTQMPNGETMIEAQARIVREMLRLRDAHRNEAIALVTHGDPIKAAVAYFLGSPLDLFLRIEVDPASISIIALDENGARIMRLNA
jgi:probable phosphomutase (TIGR03848 family)